MIKRLRNKKP